MFVRTKKIKGIEYSYLVRNEWTPWGSRQKVTKYLGKTHRPKRETDNKSTLPKGYYNTVREAIAQELRNHRFSEKDEKFTHAGLSVNLKNNKIRDGRKKVVVAMNEGYLCDDTLKQLIDFVPEENKEKGAKILATHALEAGLKLTTEQMMKLFEEAYK